MQIVAWSGDGNNVAVSWIHAAARFGFDAAAGLPGASLARRSGHRLGAARGRSGAP